MEPPAHTRLSAPSLCASLLLGAASLACVGDDGSDAGTSAGDDPQWPMAESELPRELEPALTDEESAIIASDQQALALDLYHTLRVGDFADMGFSVSPYSVAAAFGMLYGGTVGEARAQMESTLHYSLGDERQHVAHNWLDLQLADRNLPAIEDAGLDPVVVQTANGVWALESLRDEINPDYLDLIATHYGAGVFLADFASDPEAETEGINLWVSKRTNELIPELFAPGMIKFDTTMVLVNALYLKAPWAEPFEDTATSTAPFTKLDGSSVDVDMMHHDALYGSYGAGPGYAALAIPLRGNALELVFVVPDDFTAFEETLDQPTLDTMLASLEGNWVDTYIPRFELETDALLTEVLRDDLGMPAPFQDSSSFDDIVPGLGVITTVIHKTVIKVDEKGTEAAAATGIVVGEDGGGPGEPVAEFHADRPFLLMIRDRPTQSMLFFGRVLAP